MKRYLSFYDWKENKSCFLDLSNSANVCVKTTKKNIVIEITNELGCGLTHTKDWDDLDNEKVEELFKKKQDKKFGQLLMLHITKRVRDFVADTTLKNKILEVPEESKDWTQFIQLSLDKLTSPEETSDEKETKE